MKTELALKVNKLIHDSCKDVPHDIGFKVMELIEAENPILAFFKWYCNYKLNIHEGQEEKIIKEWEQV